MMLPGERWLSKCNEIKVFSTEKHLESLRINGGEEYWNCMRHMQKLMGKGELIVVRIKNNMVL